MNPQQQNKKEATKEESGIHPEPVTTRSYDESKSGVT